mgnify:FL=1
MSSKRLLSSFIIIVVYYLIAGLVVMQLWNWLLPEIFGLKAISYLEACGLILLTNFLFNRTFIPRFILKKDCENEKWAELCNDKKEHLNELWVRRCKEIEQNINKNTE